MSEYAITLARSPGLSDGEARARLNRVFRLLLEIAARKEASDGGEATDLEPSAPKPTITDGEV